MFILLSNPIFFYQEAFVINQLFDNGLPCLHLRKPNSNIVDYENLIKQINPKYYHKIKLHEHFDLVDKYDVKGIHINKRFSQYNGNKKNISMSKSCHSIVELENVSSFDYVFLSPIFNSISKNGYKSNFSYEELQNAKNKHLINNKIIALGGINPQNISIIQSFSFGGIAILGYIWKNEHILDNFLQIYKVYQELYH